MVLSNGEHVAVTYTYTEHLDKPVAIYNFEVWDFHTYFVGESSFLVHNRGCLEKTKLKSNAEVTEVARDLGYKPTKELSHGQMVFENKKASSELRYITRDIDSHSGSVWKAADSIRNLGSKRTRSGTYTRSLRYLVK